MHLVEMLEQNRFGINRALESFFFKKIWPVRRVQVRELAMERRSSPISRENNRRAELILAPLRFCHGFEARRATN